jgi:hypothetical protein
MDGGKGDDLLEDSSGDDLLKGGKGRDRLFGEVGADILVGGSGADTLAGGSGADLFTLTMEGQERDRILDFDAREDLLDLRQIFAAPQFANVSPSDRFGQFVRVEQKGANTEVFLKMEAMGSRTAMNLLATLDNVSTFTLSASQFVVS